MRCSWVFQQAEEFSQFYPDSLGVDCREVAVYFISKFAKFDFLSTASRDVYKFLQIRKEVKDHIFRNKISPVAPSRASVDVEVT